MLTVDLIRLNLGRPSVAFRQFFYFFLKSIALNRCEMNISFSSRHGILLFPSFPFERPACCPNNNTNYARLHWLIPSGGQFFLSKQGIDVILADASTSYRHRLAPATPEDAATRTEKISSAPSRSRGHPAQDDANLSQSLLPWRHGRGV